MKTSPNAMTEALRAKSDKRSVPNAGDRRFHAETSVETP